ncbi:DinB family protein [Rubrivirga sp. IMCC43871]|uniref:DinB family protein n=1 Tax=Rubrivirga sp. IMCC43871 TaxID=3391575 RepID=UPI00398FCA78
MTAAARYTVDALQKTRASLGGLLDRLSDDQWLAVPDGFRNSILWNVGHIAVTADLLTYGLARRAVPSPDWAVAAFRKGTAPDAWETPPDIAATRALFDTGLAPLAADLGTDAFADFRPYTTTPGVTLASVEEAVAFNAFHEGLHTGTIATLYRLVR